MEINNGIGAHNLTAIDQKNSLEGVKSSIKESTIDVTSTDASASKEFTLSTEGKLSQEIDAASQKIDDILLGHVTPAQKSKLNDIYQQLDQIFEKGQLTKQEEKSADALFEQVHNILESSVTKLTNSERETVENLANKMDGLIGKLDKSGFGDSPNNAVKNNSGNVDIQPSSLSNEKQKSKNALTVAELSALSVVELNKLPVNLLRKLNSQQLNKLNASQLNSLALPQLKLLSTGNIEKLNQTQTNKLAKP
ncbi:MAG: hypothetical protein HRT52_19350 [Colwellia sp.]|nr:hypothetical protein [Colwellia sp.]